MRIAGTALLLIAAVSAAGQTIFATPDVQSEETRKALQRHMEERWKVAEALEKQPEPGLDTRANAEKVEAALRSADEVWKVVTAPETPWAERMVVAERAVAQGVMPMTFMPRVVEAQRELQREERAHRFGMEPFVGRYSSIAMLTHQEFTGDRRRKILGHDWTLPATRVDQPLTYAEKRLAAWPWQVKQALEVLVRAFFTPARPAEFFEEAMMLPCRTPEEAEAFFEMTNRMAITARSLDPRVVGAWRNIALNDAMKSLRGQIEYGFDYIQTCMSGDDYRYGEVMMADLAGRLDDRGMATLSFFLHRLFTSYDRNGRESVHDRPETAIAAMGAAIDAIPPTASIFSRGYAALYFLQAADPKALSKNVHNGPDTEDDHERHWSEFRAWYAKHGEALEAAARAREPLLAPYRARLAAVSTCSGQ